MASYNRVIMMGNLTRDPEFKQLSSGQGVCRLGVASNRQFRNRQSGELTQEVCFVDVDVWGPQAESCNQYLAKGRAVLIEGRLKLDTWQDNEGQRRSKHSIVADRVTFLASQSDEVESPAAEKQAAPQAAPAKQAAAPAPAKAATDEVTVDPTDDTAGTQTGSAPTSGEVNLREDKPFEDDLPF